MIYPNKIVYYISFSEVLERRKEMNYLVTITSLHNEGGGGIAFELAMSSHTNKHAVNKNPFGDYPLLCYMLAWP